MVPPYMNFCIRCNFGVISRKLDYEEMSTMNLSQISLVGEALDFDAFISEMVGLNLSQFLFLFPPFFEFACRLPKPALNSKDHEGKIVD